MEKEVIESKPYFKYAQDIVSGKIIAGNYIILMCKRFLNDLNDDRFDQFNQLALSAVKTVHTGRRKPTAEH